jgi:hypothetical protein
MVSKCFNPACSARFRSLGEGSLFRMEPDGTLQSSTMEPEYFWLCTHCEATMTLTLGDDGIVEVIPGAPPYAHGIRRDMPLAFNRRKGLLLRSVSFWPRQAVSTVDELLASGMREAPDHIQPEFRQHVVRYTCRAELWSETYFGQNRACFSHLP